MHDQVAQGAISKSRGGVAVGQKEVSVRCVTHKSGRIADMVAAFQGCDLDARYLGYFDCFNQQRFYEAHEVLEDLWLLDRKGRDGDFYKGLIQLAGAFVHLQKGRCRPCIALLRLARENLRRYPTTHYQLDLTMVLGMTEDWEVCVASAAEGSDSTDSWRYPRLRLSQSCRFGGTPGGNRPLA